MHQTDELIYIPPSDSPYYDEEIFPQLHTETCSFQAQGNVLICGDLNARTGSLPDLNTEDGNYFRFGQHYPRNLTNLPRHNFDSQETLISCEKDPQKLHNIFSSLLNPPAPPAPSSLTAEDFATFYTEKIEKIRQTFNSAPTSSTSHSQHYVTPSLKHLSTVAAEEVLQIIRSRNPNTCPLDPIPSTMLQTISPDLLPFITTVINGSLTSGHLPTVFKKARVIPILKKPALDPSEISNYSPNNLHDPNQSGFKAAHCTETALLAVTEKLHAARSAKLSSVLILLHLSATFDTVNHKTLLSTLRSLGICGTAWEWFASYLDSRSYQLRSLHWLPVAARIRFKTLMLAYKAKNGPSPSYLKALFTPRTAPRSLRSASTARLVPPSLREKGNMKVQSVESYVEFWLRVRISCGKKLLLSLSVLAFRERKCFPDRNRENSPLLGWLRSFTIFLALVQHRLL
ncbi:hypothetical protein QTP86_013199 [Hemibagrus guttatus]|nr:hypothetical protein QTP86_013199 [Hemibagrus guttatus]